MAAVLVLLTAVSLAAAAQPSREELLSMFQDLGNGLCAASARADAGGNATRADINVDDITFIQGSLDGCGTDAPRGARAGALRRHRLPPR
jgi:hypothetical protein